MRNQVIEVLDREHGKKVIQYWKDRGVDTLDFKGECTREVGDTFRYYGCLDGVFDNYTKEYVQRFDVEIITLPEPEWKPKRGERVLVWNNNDDNTYEKIFITEIEGAKYPVITVSYAYEEYFEIGDPFDIITWQNIKPLPQVKEVTMQEIADKFGVSVEQLKIKK